MITDFCKIFLNNINQHGHNQEKVKIKVDQKSDIDVMKKSL